MQFIGHNYACSILQFGAVPNSNQQLIQYTCWLPTVYPMDCKMSPSSSQRLIKLKLFHKIKTLFSFLAVLTSALIAQWWVQLLCLSMNQKNIGSGPRLWPQAVPTVTVFFTWIFLKIQLLFKNVLDKTVRFLIILNINIYTYLLNKLCDNMWNTCETLQL
jgi:hypothetical protein